MKAINMTAAGGPEVLKYQEVPDPQIRSGTELLIKIKAAGVNPVDAKQRGRGTWYPGNLPAILGIDGAGIVKERGKDARQFNIGDEVYFAHGGIGKQPGNYAEYSVVEERFAARKPRSVSFAEAAAAPSSCITWSHCGSAGEGEWSEDLHHGELRRKGAIRS
jgi:NADPH2:quinone reductase